MNDTDPNVGSDSIAGRVLSVELRDAAGTVVANPDFEDSAVWWRGDRCNRDAAGNAWKLVTPDAFIPSGRFYLFHGYTLGWPQKLPEKAGYRVLTVGRRRIPRIEPKKDHGASNRAKQRGAAFP